MTDADTNVREWLRCADPQTGFVGFCRRHVKIQAKTGIRLPLAFDLYPCQERVAAELLAGDWLWILKARQLGLTWLVAAYALWKLIFVPYTRVIVFNRTTPYAAEFIGRVRFMYGHLPGWLQPTLTTDNIQDLGFNANGHGCLISAFAATPGAARGPTADIVIFDEAAFIDYLARAKAAAEPTVLEVANGQIIGLSTSDGPGNEFYATWQDAQSNPDSYYKPVFLAWWERPGRDQAWYDKNLRAAKDKTEFRRNYPNTPEEAFELAEGRIFAALTGNKHRVEVEHSAESGWRYYRAIDWGGVNPLVCLWATFKKGEPAFSIDPCCPNTWRELYGYHRKKLPDGTHTDEPDKVDDHTVDAVRYLVATLPQLSKGHVHVFRELYLPNSAAAGYDLNQFAAEIRKLTDGKTSLTVADRSGAQQIVTLCGQGVPTIGHKPPAKHTAKGEVADGIALLQGLMIGTPSYARQPTRAEQHWQARKRGRRLPIWADEQDTGKLLEEIEDLAQRKADRRRGKRRPHAALVGA